jgi:hypothetical protein
LQAIFRSNREIAKTKRRKKYLNTKTLTIAIILTLTISSFATFLPVNSQAVTKYPSFVYADAAPNPIGVGQTCTIVVWPAEMPPVTPTDYFLEHQVTEQHGQGGL